MEAISASLLQRLQRNGDPAAWARLVDLYSNLLFLWGCRAGLKGPEAADLVREVFVFVSHHVRDFDAATPGGFRGWLRDLARVQRRQLLQKRLVPAGPPLIPGAEADAIPAAAETLWETEYLSVLLKSSLESLQTELPAADWKACWGLTVEGRPATDLARELNLSLVEVYVAEMQVLRRLRIELDGLLS